jgi:hypothetical protein
VDPEELDQQRSIEPDLTNAAEGPWGYLHAVELTQRDRDSLGDLLGPDGKTGVLHGAAEGAECNELTLLPGEAAQLELTVNRSAARGGGGHVGRRVLSQAFDQLQLLRRYRL